jgi:hypothetical protein
MRLSKPDELCVLGLLVHSLPLSCRLSAQVFQALGRRLSVLSQPVLLPVAAIYGVAIGAAGVVF